MIYTIDSNVKSTSRYMASDLEYFVRDTGLQGLGQSFYDAEIKYMIDGLFILAHAAIESAWGTSYLFKTKNNPFGIAAYDSNPNDAYSFPSPEVAIDYYGNFLNTQYLSPTGTWYGGGTTIHDIFVHYSSDHDKEATSIVNIMNDLISKLVNATMTYKIYLEGALWWTGDSESDYQNKWNQLKGFLNNGIVNISSSAGNNPLDQYSPNGFHPTNKHIIYVEGAAWWWGDDDTDFQTKLSQINAINQAHTISVTTN